MSPTGATSSSTVRLPPSSLRRLRRTSLLAQVTTSPVSYCPDGSITRKFTRRAVGGEVLVHELWAGFGHSAVFDIINAWRRAGVLRIDAQADIAVVIRFRLNNDLHGGFFLLRLPGDVAVAEVFPE